MASIIFFQCNPCDKSQNGVYLHHNKSQKGVKDNRLKVKRFGTSFLLRCMVKKKKTFCIDKTKEKYGKHEFNR